MRKYLVEKRNELGLSQQDVADKIGVSRQYYGLIENGDRQKDMDISLLEKISIAFGIPFSELVEMERSHK